MISNFKFQISNSRGFTMIELIVTLAVLSFGVIGLYTAFTPLLYLTYNISSRFTAAYLAQEGMEIVHNIRDNNFIKSAGNPSIPWSQGYNDSTYLAINADGLYSYDLGGSPTKFKRDIIIEQDQPNSDILKVSVIVSWNYNSQTYHFTASGYLYNWY